MIRGEFDRAWQTQLLTFPKADTYRLFKTLPKFEGYLSDIKNRNHRVIYTKFRLSDHSLNIEKGRHRKPKITRDQRFCPFCPTLVENEIHFITQCTAYTDRHELFRMIINEVPNFEILNVEEQFKYLMSQESKLLNQTLTSYIYKWFKKRNELINS